MYAGVGAGPDRTRWVGPERIAAPLITVTAMAGAFAGLAAYAFWESVSKHPMTPPYLLHNRAFVGLNVTTMMAYAGLSIMFFVLPFDVIDRRELSSTDAALVFLPFTVAWPYCLRYSEALQTRSGLEFC